MTFELVARLQPIGVSALARELGEDKSALQRDLMTLADAGWIRTAPGLRGQWELTLRMMSLAKPPHSNQGLRQRMRPLLEQIHARTGETVYLTLPHEAGFMVFDALESQHIHRIVPSIGMTIPIEGSATAKAFLAHLGPADLEARLGRTPSPEMEQEFAALRACGYATSHRGVVPGSAAVAGAIVNSQDKPVSTLVVVGPAERLTEARLVEIGIMLRDTCRLGSSLWPDD